MKAIVAFDSIYGNTRKVAEAIAAELISKGHKATLVSVRDKNLELPEADILFIGSPTRMGRMTGRAKRFVKHLDEQAWKGKKAFPFDTIMKMPDDPKEREKMRRWVENGAAPRLGEMLRHIGFQVEPPLRIGVVSSKGPLVDGYEMLVKDYLKGLV
jgi:menaquinone-dependent protoporphyrinogen IX oxidase